MIKTILKHPLRTLTILSFVFSVLANTLSADLPRIAHWCFILQNIFTGLSGGTVVSYIAKRKA